MFALGRSGTLVDLGAAHADVVGTIQRERIGRLAITARAADLLIIAFDGFGQIRMGDPANVGLVHTHAEGDGRGNDESVLALEAFLGAAAGIGLHPAVIMGRAVPRLAECCGKGLGPGAGGTIDDARLPAPAIGKTQYLLARAILHREGEMDVRTVEAAQEGERRLPAE